MPISVYSYLTNADLDYADLSGADLGGADLSGANLDNVSWYDTACPDVLILIIMGILVRIISDFQSNSHLGQSAQLIISVT